MFSLLECLFITTVTFLEVFAGWLLKVNVPCYVQNTCAMVETA